MTETKYSLKQKKFFIIFTVLILALFASIRVIGTDLYSYINIFNNSFIINDFSSYFKDMFIYIFEPGFMLLISLIKQIGLGYEAFFFVSALIPMLLISNVIIKVEKKRPLTVFFFFLLMFIYRGPLDIIRHFFAASIYLSALYSLSIEKNNLFYIKTVISFFFHYSNIITIFIKPFLNIKIKLTSYLLSLTTLTIMGFFLQNMVVSVIGKLSFETSIFLKLKIYLDDNYQYDSLSQFIIRNSMENLPAIFNILLIIIALNYKQIIYKNKFYGLVLNSLIIGTLIYSFLIGFGAYVMAIRINFLFGIGGMFIVKEIFTEVIKKKRLISFILLVLYFLFYNFLIIIYYSSAY